MYKIMAVDADETLLDDHNRIPEANARALTAAQAAGVHIALCSGRSVVSLRQFAKSMALEPAKTHIISFNGAVIFDGFGNKLRDLRGTPELAGYILEKLRNQSASCAVYVETDKILFEKVDDVIRRYMKQSMVPPVMVPDLGKQVGGGFYKVIAFGENDSLRATAAYMEENARDLAYNMTFTCKWMLEFSHKDATKARGLDFVCNRLGMNMETDAIAIGDSFNDLGMIRQAAFGVCVANGEEEVKACADYVTVKDNNGGGVAEVVERFILAGKL